MFLFKKSKDWYAKYRYICTNFLSIRDGGFYCKVEKRRLLFNRFKIGWEIVWDDYYSDYNEAIKNLQRHLYRLEGIKHYDSMAC